MKRISDNTNVMGMSPTGKKWLIPGPEGFCRLAAVLILLVIGYGFWDYLNPSPRPPACVVDIDGTITSRNRPLPGAREILQWLDGCGVKMFYLSSRPIERLPGTRRWLEHQGFPRGKIIHKPYPQENRVDYKSREIGKIQEHYRIVFGIGDKDSDLAAYRRQGIIALSTDRSWWDLEALFKEILREHEVALKGEAVRP